MSLQIGSAAIVGWVARGIDALQSRRDEINSLNVFPVPDSDTGSNMLATLSSAYEEAQKADASDVRVVTAALAAGAVRGARGNSGTVLSQVFRAVAEAASGSGIGVESVQHSLKLAVQHVSQAIANPVEGTILTVLRHAAIAAEEFEGDSIEELADTIADAARDALAKTPNQLPALQQAGVVDAGGAGLVILLDALADEVSGRAAAPVDLHVDAPQVATVEMEVMYLISLADTQAVEALRERLNPLGNSLIIAGDTGNAEAAQYMVHIHTAEPGAVIEAALDFGRPVGIRIEVLDEPAPTPESTRILIAVVPDGPLKDLITSSGAIAISPTPAPTPTSTPTDRAAIADQEFADNVVTKALTAMRGADEVILLPNGLVSDQELADIEFAAAAANPTLAVVSTDSIPAGLAALAVHSAELPLAVAAYAMGEAANGTRTAVVAADVDKPLTDALTETISDLLAGGGELVTLLLGRGAEGVDIAEVRARLDKPVEVVAYDATGIEEPVQIGIE
ncbi:DAK2 domain-containing protein [Corynebacterium sp. HFH0082]|uniref:DAK2 domain-containing protein n=1 Tax=Corynebacterium sp. HFH0082 TaxID=1078764 RepID=UPI00034ECE10|nr:DAK2 domain-containing protein [Corynebacterium sp. HFH0082]EPD47147.1 DAK2 domain fusion protein YloV [Corynebacterium sp. HFH0082]